MQVRCPRCGAETRSDARFCYNCGQQLSPVSSPVQAPTAASPPVPGGYIPTPPLPSYGPPQPTAFAPPGAPAPATAWQPEYPYSRLVGRSIFAVLAPSRPAGFAFWAGLFLLLAGLLLSVCPALFGFLLFFAGDDGSGLLTQGCLASSCVSGGAVLFGLVMVVAAKPRR
jgi:hypothetical protein